MLKYAFTALLCLPYACGSEARAATPAETWLKAHNVARCIHGFPPLRWSSTVAASAQRWANSCNFYHNSFRDGYGENLAWGTTGYMTAERSAYLWYRENQGYPYGASTPPYETMHFTQMVWAGTGELGCGTRICGGMQIFVCRYSKPGNYIGLFARNVPRPVKTAAQCAL